MDERDQRLDHEHDDETAVRDLLRDAPRRPLLPAEELQAITAAARAEWRRTVERVRGEEGEERQERSGGVRWLAMAAALLLAVVLAGWWLLRPGAGAAAEVARVERVGGAVTVVPADGGEGRSLVDGEILTAGATLASGDAGHAALALGGGAAVRLDAGSRLALAAADRLRLEVGAVYVDSGACGGPGLEVRTPLGAARDVGTRFTVRVTGGDGAAAEMTVRVRDGAVEVESGGGARRRAAAGRGLVLGGDGGFREIIVAPWGAGWEWVLEAAPGFPVEGRSVADFLGWVERETGWRVRYADPALETEAREIVLHGDPGPLRPDRAPFAVLPAAGLEGELADGVLLVRRSSEPG